MNLLGSTLSHYLLTEILGEGGQGVVYRALDRRLEREVAIKVLPAFTVTDQVARKRFRREALTLSKLNHPNIAAVYDFDSDLGRDFIVMELVPGPTLSGHIAVQQMPEQELVRLGSEIAEGLAAAHKIGVLHRDIKPGNLRLTSEGRVKILDFGLAKMILTDAGSQTITTQGQIAGTIPYMAPEQLRGEGIDERSDLYALGAVLYEMATGRRAFAQRSQGELIGAILHEEPSPPRDTNPEISLQLQRSILKCLAKSPEDRYQTASELSVDLRHAGPSSGLGSAALRSSPSRLMIAAWVSTLLLGVALSFLFLRTVGLGTHRAEPRGAWLRSVAVLPLTNLSGDPSQEFFADGMTDELITRLSQVGALRVIARSSVMQYKGTKKPLQQIAKELDVGALVEGSVAREGGRVRISAQLVEPASDRNLWAESYERSLSNVLALQSDVAGAIVDKIRVRLTPAERARLAGNRTVNPAAHDAYLKGEMELSRFSSDSFVKARDYFLESIEIDPGYAPAHAGLAWSFTALSNIVLPPREAMPRAKAAALAALELDSTSVEAVAALGYVTGLYEWDWQRAEVDFKRAIALSPGSARFHQMYGYYLTANARFDEALREFQLAHQLDPMQGYIQSQLLWPLYEGRHYDAAIDQAQRLLRVNPKQWDVSIILGQAYLRKGDYSSAIHSLERAVLSDENPASLAWLAYGYGIVGQNKDAYQARERLRNLGKSQYVGPYYIAIVSLGLGDKESALRSLERAADDRSEDMVLVKVEPALDVLRSDPRFTRLLQKVGFAQ